MLTKLKAVFADRLTNRRENKGAEPRPTPTMSLTMENLNPDMQKVTGSFYFSSKLKTKNKMLSNWTRFKKQRFLTLGIYKILDLGSYSHVSENRDPQLSSDSHRTLNQKRLKIIHWSGKRKICGD